jgi:hypothetical protein
VTVTDPDKLAKYTFYAHAAATEGGSFNTFGPLTLTVDAIGPKSDSSLTSKKQKLKEKVKN